MGDAKSFTDASSRTKQFIIILKSELKKRWKIKSCSVFMISMSAWFKPQAVIKRTVSWTNGDAIVRNRRQHQMWAASILSISKRASIGYFWWFRNHGREVILLLVMVATKWQTKQALFSISIVPIKVIMLNNHSLGMVRQWQWAFYDGRTSESVFWYFCQISAHGLQAWC